MMIEYPVLYFELNIFSLALIAIILHQTKGLSKMVAQQTFSMSIISEMVFFASDTLFILVNTGTLRFGSFDNIIKLMSKEIYFLSTSMMCFFWFIYFEHLRNTAFVKEKRKVQIASLFLWGMGILLLINLFTGCLFYVDSNGVYHRGSYFILTYVLSYSYVLIAFIRTIKEMVDKSSTSDRHTLILLMIFPAAPAFAGIIQYVYPQLPVACGVLSLTTLLLYLNWINQLISLDPLTGLNNRKQLNHYYDQWIKNHNTGDSINILMIDANKFKSINDTYGHIQGDMALKNIAESLRLGCSILSKRANIARYGGDEFAILFESNNPEDKTNLEQAIKEKLKLINTRTNIPFELTVSIGSASSNGDISLKELIDTADEAMYIQKRSN